MAVHPIPELTAEEVQKLRREAGRWLRGLREDAGLSQRELAVRVGFEHYTFVSQLEGGRGRVPPGQYVSFARALSVPLRYFVKTLTKYYDPITYYSLFESEEMSVQIDPEDVENLSERLSRIENIIKNKTV